MKKIVLISSFCNNEIKLQVLKKNILNIKSLGIDVMVISPLVLSKEIQEICDYYFLTKDNPILDWPDSATYFWRVFHKYDSLITVTTTVPDYGYAAINQIKQLSDIALSLGYDQFYHIIYDLKFDDKVYETLNGSHDFLVFPSKREDTVWEVGLHLISINRENLKKLVSLISVQNYLSINSVDAFIWISSLKKIFNYEISETPVEDEIYNYENVDHFNYSNIEKVCFYIEKNDEIVSPIRLFFYDINTNEEISVMVNNRIVKTDIQNLEIVNLEFDKFNIKNTKILVGEHLQDITDCMKKIKHNVMRIQSI